MKKNPDFSILASFYDFLGLLMFQGALHKSQIYFLNKLSSPSKVLVLGGGTGKFLIDLLKSNEVQDVTYVDISPGMIKKARGKVKNLGFEGKVNFICGGLESIPNEKFDLICTHYILDCFNKDEVFTVIDKLKASLKPSGMWHFTDFYQDESSSLFKRVLLKFLYSFFRLSCGLKVDGLADFKSLFKDRGLKLVEEKYFRGTLLRTALYRI